VPFWRSGQGRRRPAVSTTNKISLVSIFVILGAWEFSRRGIELWLSYSSGADPTFVRGECSALIEQIQCLYSGLSPKGIENAAKSLTHGLTQSSRNCRRINLVVSPFFSASLKWTSAALGSVAGCRQS